MVKWHGVAVCSALLLASIATAADDAITRASETWLAYVGSERSVTAKMDESAKEWLAAADEPAAETTVEAVAETPTKPPPLPLHGIEGTGGGLITPMAYLVNPGPPGTKIALPAVSFSYLNTSNTKSLQIFTVSQTFLERITFGYSIARFDLGSFPKAVQKNIPGTRIRRHDVYLHTFNLRGLLIPENSWNCPFVPAVTAGVHFKINTGIDQIDDQALNAPKSLGYRRNCGADYTLTLSKTIPPTVLGRPVIVSVGMRNTKASNIGFTGFVDRCYTWVEANVACILSKHLAVAYEFRQKENPLHGTVHRLVGEEGPWHSILVAWIVNDRLTIAGAWGCLGEVGNTDVPGSWGIQIKYEF